MQARFLDLYTETKHWNGWIRNIHKQFKRTDDHHDHESVEESSVADPCGDSGGEQGDDEIEYSTSSSEEPTGFPRYHVVDKNSL